MGEHLGELVHVEGTGGEGGGVSGGRWKVAVQLVGVVVQLVGVLVHPIDVVVVQPIDGLRLYVPSVLVHNVGVA